MRICQRESLLAFFAPAAPPNAEARRREIVTAVLPRYRVSFFRQRLRIAAAQRRVIQNWSDAFHQRAGMAGERGVIVTPCIRQQFNIQTAVFIRKSASLATLTGPAARVVAGLFPYARRSR